MDGQGPSLSRVKRVACKGTSWTDFHRSPLLQEKVRLRYKLTFALGEQLSTELGEVDQFPPVEQWGNL